MDGALAQSKHCDFSGMAKASMREIAVACLEQGWHLVPVDLSTRRPAPDCRPTKDLTTVLGWQERDVGFNVATGARSGIVALRCHGKEGVRSLQGILRGQGVPATACCVESFNSKAKIFIFLAPDTQIESKAGIAPGLEFLGQGGHFHLIVSTWDPQRTEILPLPGSLQSLATGETTYGPTEQVAGGDFAALDQATPCEAATAYCSLGWRLVPVDGEGGSRGTEGKTDLPKLWQNHPELGMAIVTGKVSSVVGLWIGGLAEKRSLEAKYGPLPKPHVQGSVSILLFRAPTDTFPSKTLVEGVDFAGEGDLLPLPPSTLHGKKLCWVQDQDFAPGLPEMPEWLRSLLVEPAALAAAVEELRHPPPPQAEPSAPHTGGATKTPWLGTAAKRYAGRGWQVFPVWPDGKNPMIKGGFKNATSDQDQIAAWWDKWRNANIGVATGAASGVVVLDVDTKARKAGLQTLAALEAEHGPLVTLRARTPSGGLHLFFRAPVHGVGCKAGFRPGLDFRGDGGYVVAVPSKINGKEYRWENEGTAIAALPEWLFALVGAKTQKGKRLAVPPQASVTYRDALAGVQEGSRNDTIFRLACRLRQEGSDYEEALVYVRTAAGNCEPPLEEDEAIACLENAWRYNPPLALTDLGNAERFVARNGDLVRYDPGKDRWLVWSGQRWETNHRAVLRMAAATVRSLRDEAKAEDDPKRKNQLLSHGRASESKESLEAMLAIAAAELSVRAEDLDRSGLAAFSDGVFDPATGGVRPVRRGDLLTKRLPQPFNPENSECRRWLQHCGVTALANPTAAPTWGERLDRWLAERCELGQGYWAPAKELREDFMAWAREEVSPKRFGDLLAAKGFPKRKVSVWRYLGLRLRS